MNISLLARYKGEANFTLSNIITSVVTFISGIIAAAYINPEDLGTIQAMMLIVTYVSFIHLGVFNGINRNLAYYKAKGDIDKMQRQIDTSHAVSVIVSLIGGAIGMGIFIYFLIKAKMPIYLWSAAYLLVSLVFTPLTNHVENTYRSGQQFGRLGKIKNIQAAVYFVSSFLPVICGYIGRVLNQIINIVVGYFLRSYKVPYPHKSKGDWISFKELVATGAPLLIGGYIWSVFIVSDRTYIATYLSSKEMGLYTISGYCVTLISVLPTALNTLLYPKAASRYGETGNKLTMLSFWKKSIILYTLVLVPVCILLWFALPYCVDWFLPKYVGGVCAARITLLTCLTFVANGPAVLFGTFKKNFWYIIATLFFLGLFWLIVWLFGDYFRSIESIAFLRFVLSFLMMVFVLIYSYSLIKK